MTDDASRDETRADGPSSPNARNFARVGFVVTAILCAAFVAWPRAEVGESSNWRGMLAGFQIQRDTGTFVAVPRALIHFHGLDGRSGEFTFDVTARVPGPAATLLVETGGFKGTFPLDATPRNVRVPLTAHERDMEVTLTIEAASNPRPLVVSNLRLSRDAEVRNLLRSLLPALIGAIAVFFLKRGGTREVLAVSFGLLVTLAAAWFVVAAFDPLRAAALPRWLTEPLPLGFAIAFGIGGLVGRGPRSAAVSLIGIVLSLHLHTVHMGFVYDDRLWARPWTLAEIASTFWGSEDPRGISGQQYRPIPSVTHALDHLVFGPSAFAFHGTNMALHAACSWLLFALLKRAGASRIAAMVGAIGFAAHPMAASSVGWISERTDSLTDLFMLGALWVFLGPAGTRIGRVLPLALMALWSKETAVMLPAVALMFAFAFLDADARRQRLAVLRSLAGLVVLFVAVWVSLFPEKTLGRLNASATAASESNATSALSLWGNLFSQMIAPSGFEVWRSSQESVATLFWITAVGLAWGLALAGRSLDRERRTSWTLLAIGIAFASIIVLPFRGHDAVDVYRLGHSPTIGFGLALAGATGLLGIERRRVGAAVAIAVLAFLGPVARETASAWGYPGFQFRMALRFNLANETFLGGLTPAMRADLEFEKRFEEHRDEPLRVPFSR